MKILCCSNMPFAEEAFRTLGDTRSMDGRTITRRDVQDVDILAVRSTTKVDAELLRGSRVKFVGTATIGTDHFDTAYFDQAGIQWCHAPGCNANSVSEYVTAALLCLADRHSFTLEGKTLGVIGVGNVGRRVVAKAEALGMRVLQNDPPRRRVEHDNAVFVDLDTLLQESDIVTLHVPLQRKGPDATWHLAGNRFFARLKPDAIFLNAARGAVVETDALLAAMQQGIVAHTVIDTWEHEPAFRKDLLPRVDLGTPHIAGHSFEGKYIGTLMVYRSVCKFLDHPAEWTPDSLLPEPVVPQFDVNADGRPEETVLRSLVKQIYDIEQDDRKLRAAIHEKKHDKAFDRLRKHYPIRREFRFTRVTLHNATPSLRRKVADLGFTLTP